MKYKEGHFLQLSRNIFDDEKFYNLNPSIKWVYVVLNELEHKYTGDKTDFFFRSNEDLAKDANLSITVIKKAKRKLIELGLIETWQIHFRDPNTGKISEKHVTAFRIK